MSQNHINYMSGVPVKISENYKPPKKITINQSVSQRLSNLSNTTQLLASTYDFGLERRVLTKMSEWQQARQQENCDRKERIRLRQQECQKQIEERQKQMLTAVSYPSADDFSSDDNDDVEQNNSNRSDAKQKPTLESTASTIPIPNHTNARVAVPSKPQQFSPPNYFDNILVPTVMPDQLLKNGLKSTAITPNYSKINYSDFENDTSSPFDNIELKTINDLDILAQVLNTSNTIQNHEGKQLSENRQKKMINENITAEVAEQQQNQHHVQQQSNHSIVSSTAQDSMSNINYNQSAYNHEMNKNLFTYHATEFHRFDNKTIPYQLTEYSNAINTSAASTPSSLPKMNIEQFSYPLQHQNQYLHNNYYNSNFSYTNTHTTDVPPVITTSNVQQSTSNTSSKWKSVPDILQEINDELNNSERKRTRNISQNVVAGMYSKTNFFFNKWISILFDFLPIFSLDESRKSSTLQENGQNLNYSKTVHKSLYNKLSNSSQKLAQNISSMGFPLERVARITDKLGNDDKKVCN